MADNQSVSSTPYDVATDKVTYSGDADRNVQLVRVVNVSGAEGSRTVDAVTNSTGVVVVGNVANDVADSGNPVKVGGIANALPPASVTDGDRVAAWFNSQGSMTVDLRGPDGQFVVSGDGVAITTTSYKGLPVDSRGGEFVATGQVAPTATAATLLASRSYRQNVTFYNGTNMTVFIGPATVSTANGFELPPGAGISLTMTALIQQIVATVTGLTGTVSYVEIYNT